jgi:hypothetical protein
VKARKKGAMLSNSKAMETSRSRPGRGRMPDRCLALEQQLQQGVLLWKTSTIDEAARKPGGALAGWLDKGAQGWLSGRVLEQHWGGGLARWGLHLPVYRDEGRRIMSGERGKGGQGAAPWWWWWWTDKKGAAADVRWLAGCRVKEEGTTSGVEQRGHKMMMRAEAQRGKARKTPLGFGL